jgi:hypothetical protein
MSELPAGRQLDIRIHQQFFGADVQRREHGDKADYFYYDDVVVRSVPVADDSFDFYSDWLRVPDYSTDAEDARLLEDHIHKMGGSVFSEYLEARDGVGSWRVTITLLGKKPMTREAPGETCALALCHAALAALAAVER